MTDNAEYIEVDTFVLGVYQGTTRVHRDSLVGTLLRGDLCGGAEKAKEMQDELSDRI